MKSFVMVCRSCGEVYEANLAVYTCRACSGRLRTEYALCPDFCEAGCGQGIWRYVHRLPVFSDERICLGEGNTPLIDFKGVPELHEKEVWLKNETLNPTGTYKDRPAALAVTRAKELGARGVVVASDGNTAPAVAAYAAKGGLPCLVLMPQTTPPARYTQAKAYGAKVFLVDGNINDCLDLAREVSRLKGYHNCSTASNLNPYQLEANKTIAFEIYEQLDGRLPRWVAVPVGGGGLLVGIARGFEELHRAGMINSVPRILAVQSVKCAPFVRAFERGEEVQRWEGSFQTVALTIAVPYPPDGDLALEAVRQANGHALAVTEDEILQAQTMRARTGVLTEPTGAVSLAGFFAARKQGIIPTGDSCVAVLTGTGLKAMEFFEDTGQDIICVSNMTSEILDRLN